METFRRSIIVILALTITMPVVIKSCSSGQIPAPAAFSVGPSRISVVRISGDVRHPGIYPITATMVTGDAIKMAEPLTPPKFYFPRDINKVKPMNGNEIRIGMNPDGSAEIMIKPLPTAQRLDRRMGRVSQIAQASASSGPAREEPDHRARGAMNIHSNRRHQPYAELPLTGPSQKCVLSFIRPVDSALPASRQPKEEL